MSSFIRCDYCQKEFQPEELVWEEKESEPFKLITCHSRVTTHRVLYSKPRRWWSFQWETLCMPPETETRDICWSCIRDAIDKAYPRAS